MSIADRMQKAQRIKLLPAMERDPENQRSSALKVSFYVLKDYFFV